MIESIAPRVKNNGYIQKEDFLKVCRWKSARPRKHHEGNSPELIEEITRIALSPKTSDELKIKALTLLSGIKWPMASVFLHFFDEQRYPILDFRALSSLSIPEPKNGYDVLYDYPFWNAYTEHCRMLANQAKIEMRTLDRALWQYSKDNIKGTI